MKQIISLTEDKLKLLKELDATLKEESVDIVIDCIHIANRDVYIAYDKVYDKVLETGTKLKIKKYLSKRNITSVFRRKDKL